jgi:hypothetical protein
VPRGSLPEGIWKRDQASTGAANMTTSSPCRVPRGAFRRRTFDHVGQLVIGARAGAVELVEHGDQGFLGVVGQQAVDVGGEAGFPECILDPVRRLAESRCKSDQEFGVRRLAGAARKAVAFHG